MIVVELRRRRPDTADVETVARISVREPTGPALIEALGPGDGAWVDSQLRAGVPDARGRTRLPAEGEAFALAVLQAFRGSRLWAERVSDPGSGGPADRA